jgi:hypothetical protein
MAPTEAATLKEMAHNYQLSPSVKILDKCPNSSLTLNEEADQILFKEDTTSLTP